MEFLKSFIIGAVITAVAYLIVPAIFCLIGRDTNRFFSLKTIKKIVIINGLCVWLIFQIIRLNSGETVNVIPLFIWSGVAYWFMRKIMLKKTANDGENNSYKEPVDLFGDANKKERRYKTAITVVSLLLVVSLGLNIYQAMVTPEAEQELEQSSEKVVFVEVDPNREKVEFFDEYIVFVEDDGTNLYHKYECNRFTGDNFWAYNVDQAVSIGYEPCPICCKG